MLGNFVKFGKRFAEIQNCLLNYLLVLYETLLEKNKYYNRNKSVAVVVFECS